MNNLSILSEKVLDILSDNKEWHYWDIAKILKVSPNRIAVTLTELKSNGLVESPSVTLTITKKKSGVYKLRAHVNHKEE